MRRYWYGAAAALGLAIGLATIPLPASGKVELPSAVRIMLDGGSGSGVHIGNGYILTAAHVVDSPAGLKVRPDGGGDVAAHVLWAHAEYDVALLHIADFSNLASANLECRSPIIGEEISTTGNPFGLEFVTSWGKVSGREREFDQVKSAMLSDMGVVFGNSGGPVYDSDGDLIGTIYGVMETASKSVTGISLFVPASTICNLLART